MKKSFITSGPGMARHQSQLQCYNRRTSSLFEGIFFASELRQVSVIFVLYLSF